MKSHLFITSLQISQQKILFFFFPGHLTASKHILSIQPCIPLTRQHKQHFLEFHRQTVEDAFKVLKGKDYFFKCRIYANLFFFVPLNICNCHFKLCPSMENQKPGSSVLFVGGIIWWAANTRGGAYPFWREKASDPLREDQSYWLKQVRLRVGQPWFRSQKVKNGR